MADTHFEVDRNTERGGEMKQIFASLRRAWDDLSHLRGAMIAMQDTAATGNAVFAKQAAQFGYGGADVAAQQAQAAASFAKIDSNWAALSAKVNGMIESHM